jgi:hypothetical protein
MLDGCSVLLSPDRALLVLRRLSGSVHARFSTLLLCMSDGIDHVFRAPTGHDACGGRREIAAKTH